MDQPTCTACSRTFHSPTARARHELRCRARPRPRRRACGECARSKVRCDHGTPACGRCGVMKLACAYPQGAYPQGAPARADEAGVDVDPPGVPLTPVSEPWLRISAVSHAEMAEWGEGLLGWSDEALSLGLGDPFSLGAGGEVLDAGGENSQRRYAEEAAPTDTPASPASTPFASLSRYLAERCTTIEKGLDSVDAYCKSFADGLLTAGAPHFVHPRAWAADRRHEYLLPVTSIAQLYASGTPGSEGVLLCAIEAQLHRIQVKIPKHSRGDDLAAMQAVLLYSAMRIYRSSTVAAETMDRISMRLCQHVLSKYLSSVKPRSRVEPGDWEAWIQDESLCRCFLALHALDYISNSRQGVPTAICALFDAAPLPAPDDVWAAPGPTEWAARHGVWEARCGEVLRGGDLLCWVRGRETGREGALEEWLCGAGGFGGCLVVCARAQVAVGGVF